MPVPIGQGSRTRMTVTRLDGAAVDGLDRDLSYRPVCRSGTEADLEVADPPDRAPEHGRVPSGQLFILAEPLQRD
jgi:hypothetical protein